MELPEELSLTHKPFDPFSHNTNYSKEDWIEQGKLLYTKEQRRNHLQNWVHPEYLVTKEGKYELAVNKDSRWYRFREYVLTHCPDKWSTFKTQSLISLCAMGILGSLIMSDAIITLPKPKVAISPEFAHFSDHLPLLCTYPSLVQKDSTVLTILKANYALNHPDSKIAKEFEREDELRNKLASFTPSPVMVFNPHYRDPLLEFTAHTRFLKGMESNELRLDDLSTLPSYVMSASHSPFSAIDVTDNNFTAHKDMLLKGSIFYQGLSGTNDYQGSLTHAPYHVITHDLLQKEAQELALKQAQEQEELELAKALADSKPKAKETPVKIEATSISQEMFHTLTGINDDLSSLTQPDLQSVYLKTHPKILALREQARRKEQEQALLEQQRQLIQKAILEDGLPNIGGSDDRPELIKSLALDEQLPFVSEQDFALSFTDPKKPSFVYSAQENEPIAHGELLAKSEYALKKAKVLSKTARDEKFSFDTKAIFEVQDEHDSAHELSVLDEDLLALEETRSFQRHKELTNSKVSRLGTAVSQTFSDDVELQVDKPLLSLSKDELALSLSDEHVTTPRVSTHFQDELISANLEEQQEELHSVIGNKAHEMALAQSPAASQAPELGLEQEVAYVALDFDKHKDAVIHESPNIHDLAALDKNSPSLEFLWELSEQQCTRVSINDQSTLKQQATPELLTLRDRSSLPSSLLAVLQTLERYTSLQGQA